MFLGVFKKGKGMNKSHAFYPMITGSVKTILLITPSNELDKLVDILIEYPNHKKNEGALVDALIQELDRQYARWNKGGING